MNKINWKNSLVTAAMTISGLLTVLWIAVQMVDSNYKARIEGLDLYLSMVNEKSLRLEEQIRESNINSENEYQHMKSNMTKTCNLFLKTPEISLDLTNHCKEILEKYSN